jgi:hypothetical protein
MMRLYLFVALFAGLLFSGCDNWSSTLLKNDLREPVRLHLYYQWTGEPTRKVGIGQGDGTIEYIWVHDSPEGELPLCHPPGSSHPTDSLGDGFESYPILDSALTERGLRAAACLDTVSGSNAFVLHWTLAPGEELFMARALGFSGGHYLDSLAMDYKGMRFALRSPDAIFPAIKKTGYSSFRLKTSLIKKIGESEPLR